MNKIDRRWIPIFAGVLLIPCVLNAASIEPKSWELNGFVSYQHTSAQAAFFGETADVSISTLDFEPGAGFFLTSNWEILGTLIFEHQTVSGLSLGFPGIDDETSSDEFGVKASAYYHFNTSGAVIPFVGVGFGVLGFGGDNNPDTEYTLPEAVVGMRWPVRNVISLNFTGGYRRITTFEDGRPDTDQFFLGAGLSVFLRGGAAR
jgi:hypothetical protein